MKIKKRLKMIFYTFLIFEITFIIGIAIFIKLSPQFGAKSIGERLTRLQDSPNYKNGKFFNPVKTDLGSIGGITKGMFKYFLGGGERTPKSLIPVIQISQNHFDRNPEDSLKITWLGHSTSLVEMEGYIILLDPMLGQMASPISFLGPKRFNSIDPIEAKDLPELDAVVISHDHYDHLNYQTILDIKNKTKMFYVPLGVAAHLESWGVDSEKIVEHDWWDTSALDSKIVLICTPSRHFSGRGILDRMETLWCSWVIKSEKYSIFFGGDSGYFEGFKEIGEKFGPFDITMLESGAYSIYWPAIHMMPEETVQAHLDLQGKILMPIHWGAFNLSIHSWTEPIERLLKKADQENVTVTTPIVGESIIMTEPIPQKFWWR